MIGWPDLLDEGLDILPKLDLLSYPVGAGGRPVGPAQASGDLGCGEADVMEASRALAAPGVVVLWWQDGAPYFVGPASPEAQRETYHLVRGWDSLRQPCAGSEGNRPKEKSA